MPILLIGLGMCGLFGGTQCLAYHRDRGEEFVQIDARSFDHVMEEMKEHWMSYAYVFSEGGWKVAQRYDPRGSSFRSLLEELTSP